MKAEHDVCKYTSCRKVSCFLRACFTLTTAIKSCRNKSTPCITDDCLSRNFRQVHFVRCSLAGDCDVPSCYDQLRSSIECDGLPRTTDNDVSLSAAIDRSDHKTNEQ